MPTFAEKILSISNLNTTATVAAHLLSAGQSTAVQEPSVYITRQVNRGIGTIAPNLHLRSKTPQDVSIGLNELAQGVASRLSEASGTRVVAPSVMVRSGSKQDIEMAMNQLARQLSNQIKNVRDGA